MRNLIDRLKLRTLIVKEEFIDYMKCLGFYPESWRKKEEEIMQRHMPKEKVTYDIITIPGIDEYLRDHPNR